MKKITLLSIIVLFVSCGKNKNEEMKEVNEQLAEKTELVLNAIYEKDDTLKVVYKADGYYHEDFINKLVTGSPMPQDIKVELPIGVKIENVNLNLSYNKAQEFLTMNYVEIIRNDKTILKRSDYLTGKYFNAGEALTFDHEKFCLKLSHDKKFPPLVVGTQDLEILLK